MCVHGVSVFDGDMRVLFEKSRFMSEGFFHSLDDHDGALGVFRACQNEGCVLCEQ